MSCSRGCCDSQLEHYRSVSIAASACPSRSGGRHAARLNATEKRWNKDFPVVKQLKKDGIVPRTTEGVADLVARAETRTEIEYGKVLNKKQRDQYAQVMGKEMP